MGRLHAKRLESIKTIQCLSIALQELEGEVGQNNEDEIHDGNVGSPRRSVGRRRGGSCRSGSVRRSAVRRAWDGNHILETLVFCAWILREKQTELKAGQMNGLSETRPHAPR